MGMTKKSFISLLLSFSLVFSLVSMLYVAPVDAKTVRVAIISALSGDVTIKKGGGSKTYDAYESMSLNQGDTVYTGASSSVTLNLASGDADVTLGDNAEINVSDLNSSNGNKKSKIKVWAGSMWVKVKSLAGADDEFEVETPTAVMGVRGTQFFVSVDPVSGKTKMAVGSGRVSASTVTTNADETQTTTITYLYPTQQISLDNRDETTDLDLKVEFLDLEDFIKQASPEIIKELILNKAEIDKENDEFIAKKQKEIDAGLVVGDQTSLSIKNQSDLDKVKHNLDNIIGNIAKTALAENKVDKDSLNIVIEEANKKIALTERKLDLDNVKPLDKTAGVDPELEKKKQEALKKLEEEKLKAKLESDKKAEEAMQNLADALKKLEEEKKRIEEEKKAAEEKEKAEAEAKLKATLTEQEKTAFEEAKAGSTTESNTSTDSNPSTDPGTTPTPKVSLEVDNVITNPPSYVEGPTVTHYNLNINLTDFSGVNGIYGVEVHLLYGHNTEYVNDSPLANKEFFNTTAATGDSVDYYKVYESEAGSSALNEFIYAVTKFGITTNTSNEGKKKLVSIPMVTENIDQISVGKIVIVRLKTDGSVQRIEIPLTTIAQVQVGS